MLNTRIAIPATATAAEVIEIKTLVSHPMESGFRYDLLGNRIPRNLLERFTCTYLGQTVIEVAFGTGVAANPFLSFHLRATSTGPVVFEWIDQQGETTREVRQLAVTVG
ncbi:MAG: thiosulfate oxidation carrier complex protein SoxZ [Pseudomonadota bacterium]